MDPPPGFVVLPLGKGGVCVIPERTDGARPRLGMTRRWAGPREREPSTGR